MDMKEQSDMTGCKGTSAYQKKYFLVHIFSLLALTFICYWKFLDNHYVLEDTGAPYAGFVLNKDISRIFTECFTAYGATWRVVVMLSYIPNYWLSGIDPWSYRLFSLFFHFLNALLVYLIANRLLRNINLSFIVAVLFSTSLNKVSAIGMVAHRVTLFGSLFPLLSLYFYIKLVQDNFSKKTTVLFFLSFLAAIGSYETGLIMPAVYITFGLLFKEREFFSKNLLWLNSICLLVSLSIIFALSLGTSSHGMSIISDKTLFAKGVHMARNILSALPSFIIPPFIMQDKSREFYYYSALVDFGWIELISFVLIIITSVYSIKSKNKVMLFAIFFLIITLVPVSIIRWSYFPESFSSSPSFVGWLRFDIGRYSYLSSFGAYLIIGIVLYDLFEYVSHLANRKIVMAGAATMLMLYVAFNVFWIYKRERYWQYASNITSKEVAAIKSFNLSVDRNTAIYHRLQILYGVHGRNMLRAMYRIPDLEVFDLNYEIQKIRPSNKKTILIESSDTPLGLSAVYLSDNSIFVAHLR